MKKICRKYEGIREYMLSYIWDVGLIKLNLRDVMN